MNVTVNVVPRAAMRYATLDDYWREEGGLVVHVADTGNDAYTRLILIHALIEQLLVERAGVTEAAILAHDLAHPDSPEPGDEPDAPYRDAHGIAVGVERMLCGAMGIPWREYEAALEAVVAGSGDRHADVSVQEGNKTPCM